MAHPKPKPKQTKPPAKLQGPFLLLVFISAFLLYANTFRNEYSLDDDIYTKKNTFVQEGFKPGFSKTMANVFGKGSLVGFNKINEGQYRPLALLNFVVDTSFFGNNPHAEHFINVLLYGLSAIMLLLVLQKIFKKYNPYVPLLITLLFVFHPVHTEVVASIKSRDEILAWLFGLLSFHYLLRYAENGRRSQSVSLSLFFFFLSGLCKETSLTFVLIAPMMLYFFTGVPLKKIVQCTLLFGGVILVYFLMRAGALENLTFKDKIVVMNNTLMAAKNGGEMLATNFVILGKYIWLLVFPMNLTWDYSFNQVPIVDFTDWKAIVSVLIYLGMGVYVLKNFIKKDVFVFSILLYLVTLFLSSNLVIKINSTMAERFLYVPSLGFCIAAVLLLLNGLKINPMAPVWSRRSAVFAVAGIVLLLYGFKTIDRNKAWKNNFELFTSGLDISNGSARAHYAVASEYRVKGETEPDPARKMNYFRSAVDEYNKGIKIYNEDSEVWYNLGVTYFDMGDTANARRVYARAIEIKPSYSMALNNTGVIFFNQKNYPKALACFKKIMAVDSGFTDALGNIGATYHNMGDFRTATVYYEKALKKDPYNKSTLKNIVSAYKSLGDSARANFYAQRAATLK